MARLKDKAAKLFGRGRYDKAALAYRQVVADDPRDMNSRLRLGDAYRRLGKSDVALACYREVADFYARDGMLLKAIAACKLVLGLDPSHGDTQSLLADLYAKRFGTERGAAPAAGRVSGVGAAKAADPAASTPPLFKTAEPEAAASLSPPVEQATPPVEQATPPVEQAAADEPISSDSGLEDPFLVDTGSEGGELEVDLDDFDDEEIDIGLVEPPPPPPAPEQRSLPTIPLFSDLPREAFIELLERMQLRLFEPGQVVIEEGEKGNSFYVVVSGSLRVTRSVDGGTVSLATLGEGHFLGEMALLSTRPRQATVTAQGEAELFELDRPLLDDLRERHPSLREALDSFYRQRLLGNVLATSPVFRPFEKSERRELIDHFKALEIAAGQPVLCEGEHSDGLYVVLSGELAAVRGSGFQEVTLGRLAEGDVFGEISLLSREPATATVKTLARSVLLRMSKETFADLAMTHPQMLEAMSRLSDSRQAKTAEVLARVGSSMAEADLDDDTLVML